MAGSLEKWPGTPDRKHGVMAARLMVAIQDKALRGEKLLAAFRWMHARWPDYGWEVPIAWAETYKQPAWWQHAPRW